ncbi:hypothetical protein ACFV3R_00325 [Streptomyces sp. NPDC059740]|uniref:hypothetical protein n=1 Tax=Streptomyces sp. NPDC059740 TaxID=3346926 RepID=UPI0036659492
MSGIGKVSRPADTARALLAAGYERLGWPLYRGVPACACTSRPRNCANPGGRLVGGRQQPVPARALGDHLSRHPDDALLTVCGGRFDTVTLPRDVGSALLVQLDRQGDAFPALWSGDRELTLLVRAGSTVALGELLSERARAVLRLSSTRTTLPLPPTHGMAWDTPPWDPATGTPRPLPSAGALLLPLRSTVRLYARG